MKDFWETQAEKYKEDVMAVNFDPQEEELELYALDNLIKDNETILDLGCGNGRTIIRLAPKKPNSCFYGIDFAKGMIDIANKTKEELKQENVKFWHFDASSKGLPSFLNNKKYDKIITKRLLINLKGNKKYDAIDNIFTLLKKDGIYIMIECFKEPLIKINEIRKKLELDEITVKFFNEYLTHDIFNKINNKFFIYKKIDFESLYYFISRVFNAFLANGEPDYNSPINKLAVKLIQNGVNPVEGYSPEILYLLKKVGK